MMPMVLIAAVSSGCYLRFIQVGPEDRGSILIITSGLPAPPESTDPIEFPVTLVGVHSKRFCRAAERFVRSLPKSGFGIFGDHAVRMVLRERRRRKVLNAYAYREKMVGFIRYMQQEFRSNISTSEMLHLNAYL